MVVAAMHVFEHPVVITDWWAALTAEHGNPFVVAGIALLVLGMTWSSTKRFADRR